MSRRAASDMPPAFVCRETAARLCEISVDTWDLWVRDGFAPPAAIERGQIKRWHWPDVTARFIQNEIASAADPYMQGVANADQKARRRIAS